MAHPRRAGEYAKAGVLVPGAPHYRTGRRASAARRTRPDARFGRETRGEPSPGALESRGVAGAASLPGTACRVAWCPGSVARFRRAAGVAHRLSVRSCSITTGRPDSAALEADAVDGPGARQLHGSGWRRCLLLSLDSRWSGWRLLIQTFFVATVLLLIGAVRASDDFIDDRVTTLALCRRPGHSGSRATSPLYPDEKAKQLKGAARG